MFATLALPSQPYRTDMGTIKGLHFRENMTFKTHGTEKPMPKAVECIAISVCQAVACRAWKQGKHCFRS
jgi:hypothetical protein